MDACGEWGCWVEHDGSGCPLPLGTVVHRVFNVAVDLLDGEPAQIGVEHVGPVIRGEMPSWCGVSFEVPGRGYVALVVRYRVWRPAALMQLKRIAAHPEPEAVPA